MHWRYVAGNASLNIHGNLSIKGEDGTWGVENTANSGGAYARYSTSGLYAGSDYTIQKGGHITVDGDVDLKVRNGQRPGQWRRLNRRCQRGWHRFHREQ